MDINYGMEDLVPAVYAHNWKEANFYKTLLEDYDIPVVIGDDDVNDLDVPANGDGVPILVPEEALAEAKEFLAQRDELEDEFDEVFEDVDYCNEDDRLDGFDELNPDGNTVSQIADQEQEENEGQE